MNELVYRARLEVAALTVLPEVMLGVPPVRTHVLAEGIDL